LPGLKKLTIAKELRISLLNTDQPAGTS